MDNTIVMAIFLKDNKVLLEKRKAEEDNYAGVYAFPGGHAEEGEEIEDALQREMKEELNIQVKKYQLIGEFEDIDPTSQERYIFNVFLCKEWEGEIKDTAEEESIIWVELDEVNKLENVSEPVFDMIKKLKEVI